MHISLQKTLLNRNVLKISSLLLGFLLWALVSSFHATTITLTVPLCFYCDDGSLNDIEAPDQITITLRGPKQSLRALDFSKLAAHIHLRDWPKNAPRGITITRENLFLPEDINVINYIPKNIAVEKRG